MQSRIRPQAERCKDKLTMLMQKQTMDLERWLLRHATAVKLLQEQSVASLAACLELQERMLISRAGTRAVLNGGRREARGAALTHAAHGSINRAERH
jgi:hypothetical protein